MSAVSRDQTQSAGSTSRAMTARRIGSGLASSGLLAYVRPTIGAT